MTSLSNSLRLPLKKWADLGTKIRNSNDFPHDFKFILQTIDNNGPSTLIPSHCAFLKARLPQVVEDSESKNENNNSFILPSWIEPNVFRLFYEVCK